ncbi:MAG: response regulator transcription factor [Spirochaetales bacterium]|nr:response regulator transcription factor [Spirochaetales bacterium]
MSPLILVADDEEKIRKMVCDYLVKMGFRTLAVSDGVQAMTAIENQGPDLVLLDVMMPGQDGFQLAKHLWSLSGPPFLFMTARDEEADKVLGLELGADDYITKPFSLRELTARIQAVLRRVRNTEELTTSRVLTWKDLIVDVDAFRVTRNHVALELTAVQFQILLLFLSSPGRVWSRSQILESVRETSFEGYERTIDVHVKNLRKTLGDDVKSPRYIETVRGVGYRLIRD